MSLIAAERIKLVSTRSPWWCAGLATVASVGLSALIAVSTNNEGQPATVGSTQFGYTLGMAVVMVMATLAVTTEYSVGTIRTTFMAVPGRTPALLAKAVVVAVLAAVIGLVGAFGAWGVSLALLPDADLSLSGADALAAGCRRRPGLPDRRRDRCCRRHSRPAHGWRGVRRAGLGADGGAVVRAHSRGRRRHATVAPVPRSKDFAHCRGPTSDGLLGGARGSPWPTSPWWPADSSP